MVKKSNVTEVVPGAVEGARSETGSAPDAAAEGERAKVGEAPHRCRRLYFRRRHRFRVEYADRSGNGGSKPCD